jgi:hypothetical protein
VYASADLDGATATSAVYGGLFHAGITNGGYAPMIVGVGAAPGCSSGTVGELKGFDTTFGNTSDTDWTYGISKIFTAEQSVKVIGDYLNMVGGVSRTQGFHGSWYDMSVPPLATTITLPDKAYVSGHTVNMQLQSGVHPHELTGYNLMLTGQSGTPEVDTDFDLMHISAFTSGAYVNMRSNSVTGLHVELGNRTTNHANVTGLNVELYDTANASVYNCYRVYSDGTAAYYHRYDRSKLNGDAIDYAGVTHSLTFRLPNSGNVMTESSNISQVTPTAVAGSTRHTAQLWFTSLSDTSQASMYLNPTASGVNFLNCDLLDYLALPAHAGSAPAAAVSDRRDGALYYDSSVDALSCYSADGVYRQIRLSQIGRYTIRTGSTYGVDLASGEEGEFYIYHNGTTYELRVFVDGAFRSVTLT